MDFVSPDKSGRIRPEQILDLVSDRTLLVSMMHVNSETGIIQPIREIGEALSETKTYFHIDATQGFGKLNGDLRSTKYDMLSITAHKLGGPQGIGGLVLKRDIYSEKMPPDFINPDLENVKHQLGNLVLYGSDANSSLPVLYEDKRPHYQRSGISTAIEIANAHDHWTIDEFKHRHSKICTRLTNLLLRFYS